VSRIMYVIYYKEPQQTSMYHYNSSLISSTGRCCCNGTCFCEASTGISSCSTDSALVSLYMLSAGAAVVDVSPLSAVSVVVAAAVELALVLVVVFLAFGILLLANFANCPSRTFALAFISVVSITGSSYDFTDFCFSTQVFNHTSCSLRVFF